MQSSAAQRIRKTIVLSIIVAAMILATWLLMHRLLFGLTERKWQQLGGNAGLHGEEMRLIVDQDHRIASLDQMKVAAKRLNQLGCKGLRFSGVNWNCSEFQSILSGLHLSHLTLHQVPLDDTCVQFISQRKDIGTLQPSSSLSISQVRSILSGAPHRQIQISQREFPLHEIDMLVAEFGSRVFIY